MATLDKIIETCHKESTHLGMDKYRRQYCRLINPTDSIVTECKYLGKVRVFNILSRYNIFGSDSERYECNK